MDCSSLEASKQRGGGDVGCSCGESIAYMLGDYQESWGPKRGRAWPREGLLGGQEVEEGLDRSF